MKLFLPLLLATCLPTSAAIIFEEIGGSLSDSQNNPTIISATLSEGDNTIRGTINEIELAQSTFRPDAFTITVPTGFVVTSLTYNERTSIGSNTDVHFLALHDQTGSFDPISNAIFATLVAGTDNSTNLLPLLTDGGTIAPIGDQPRGFTFPLTSGDYTLWFQETDENQVEYDFTFTLASIPEPQSIAFILTGVLLGLGRRSRN